MGEARHKAVFLAGSLVWGLPAVALCQDDATRALVNSLGSEVFKERIQAQMDLSRWALEKPAVSQPWLFREFEATGEPEVRLRLREVLKTVVVAEHQKDGPGYVGIGMEDVEVMVAGEDGPEARAGVKVTRVQAGTPASRAGLQIGDVVVAVDKLKWTSGPASPGFQQAIMKHKPGDKVELSILRGQELKKIDVTLAARPMGLPDAAQAQAIQLPQGFQGIPGIRLNIVPLDDAALKALEEKQKADEKKAQEDCLEAWLREQRARGK